MEGKKFSFTKVASNNIDKHKFYVQIVTLIKGLQLSNTEILVLSTFLVNGYNKFTKEQLIDNKLIKNNAIMANMISKFRKTGLIVKNGHSEQLCEELNVTLGKDLNLLQILIKNK